MRAGYPGAVVSLARGPRDVRLTGFTGFSEAPADVSNRGRTLLGIVRFARWNAKSQDSYFKELWGARGPTMPGAASSGQSSSPTGLSLLPGKVGPLLGATAPSLRTSHSEAIGERARKLFGSAELGAAPHSLRPRNFA